MTMRHWVMCGTAAVALLLAGCGGEEGNKVAAPPGGQKIAPVPAPAGTDWTQVVEATPDGGYRMGNPKAPVKLLEYGSFGCPHCAEFDAEGSGPLENTYVKSGRVSWEFRSFLLFPQDPAVTLAAECNGPQPFFLLKRQLYANQQDWETKLQPAMDSIARLPAEQRLKPMIQASGLDAFFRQRGMPQAKIDACLSDAAALQRVIAVSQRGIQEFGVEGTPSFYINGVKVQVTTWPALEPELKRALGE